MDTLALAPPKSRWMVVRVTRDLPTVVVSKSRFSTCPHSLSRFSMSLLLGSSSWVLPTVESGSMRPDVLCLGTDHSSHLRALYIIDIITRLLFISSSLVNSKVQREASSEHADTRLVSGIRSPERERVRASSDGTHGHLRLSVAA